MSNQKTKIFKAFRDIPDVKINQELQLFYNNFTDKWVKLNFPNTKEYHNKYIQSNDGPKDNQPEPLDNIPSFDDENPFIKKYTIIETVDVEDMTRVIYNRHFRKMDSEIQTQIKNFYYAVKYHKGKVPVDYFYDNNNPDEIGRLKTCIKMSDKYINVSLGMIKSCIRTILVFKNFDDYDLKIVSQKSSIIFLEITVLIVRS